MGDENTYHIEPNTYDLTWLGDRYKTTISGDWGRDYTITRTTSAGIGDSWSINTTPHTWGTCIEHTNAYRDAMLYDKKEDLPQMFTSEDDGNNYMVSCNEEKDLTAERILKSLSIMKGKLEIDCAAIRVNKIECYMTPAVKTNIIKAGKRLAMYGKPRPFVARFDEYGNQLPDEISIDASERNDIKDYKSRFIRRILFCPKSYQ